MALLWKRVSFGNNDRYTLVLLSGSGCSSRFVYGFYVFRYSIPILLCSHLGQPMALGAMREWGMSPVDKPSNKKDKSELPDDPRPEWSEEDIEIEDRKPDLGEIEEDTSEING
jgi:hypothetical protein